MHTAILVHSIDHHCQGTTVVMHAEQKHLHSFLGRLSIQGFTNIGRIGQVVPHVRLGFGST